MSFNLCEHNWASSLPCPHCATKYQIVTTADTLHVKQFKTFKFDIKRTSEGFDVIWKEPFYFTEGIFEVIEYSAYQDLCGALIEADLQLERLQKEIYDLKKETKK